MPVYSVEGKLGTGKTKFCVWMAQQALREGRRVASNVDIDTTKLLPGRRARYVRIPDKPTSTDLAMIGHGNPESYDESRNGVLILDELGSWLNARAFQDKDRLAVIDWMIHARKYGWDVYLIVQDAGMIDKQVREALIEYQCRCMRADKVRIPFIGWALSAIYKPLGYLPRMHIVTARVGYGQNAIVAERWFFRGEHLHSSYDTRQVFTSDYAHGSHSVLPPWNWKPDPVPLLLRWLLLAREVVRGIVRPVARQRPKVQPKPKHPLAASVMSLPVDQRLPRMRELLMQRQAQERSLAGRLLALRDVDLAAYSRWASYAIKAGHVDLRTLHT